MNPSIGIQNKEVDAAAIYLNTLLADEYALFTKTRDAHWNITGPKFYELHKLFEKQFEAIDAMIDDIAERVRSLGHLTLGSMKDFLNTSPVSQEKYDFSNSMQIIQSLNNDHETIIRKMRDKITPISDKITDQLTANFVTGLMAQHEKMIWMLRTSI